MVKQREREKRPHELLYGLALGVLGSRVLPTIIKTVTESVRSNAPKLSTMASAKLGLLFTGKPIARPTPSSPSSASVVQPRQAEAPRKKRIAQLAGAPAPVQQESVKHPQPSRSLEPKERSGETEAVATATQSMSAQVSANEKPGPAKEPAAEEPADELKETPEQKPAEEPTEATETAEAAEPTTGPRTKDGGGGSGGGGGGGGGDNNAE